MSLFDVIYELTTARTSQIICYNIIDNDICLITDNMSTAFGKYLFEDKHVVSPSSLSQRVGIYLYCYATLQL